MTRRLVNKFIFIGSPGVGKGTFAKLISQKHFLKHISLGEIFRSEVTNNSLLAPDIDKFLSQGRLIPDELANEVISSTLSELRPETGFILDGYPRTVSQAKYLDEYLQTRHKGDPASGIIRAVNITLRNDVALEKIRGRVTCGKCGQDFNTASVVRDGFDMPAILPDSNGCWESNEPCDPHFKKRDDDQSDEVISKRLQLHDELVSPLLDYYGKLNRLQHFPVQRGIEDTNDLFHLMSAPIDIPNSP